MFELLKRPKGALGHKPTFSRKRGPFKIYFKR